MCVCVCVCRYHWRGKWGGGGGQGGHVPPIFTYATVNKQIYIYTLVETWAPRRSATDTYYILKLCIEFFMF